MKERKLAFYEIGKGSMAHEAQEFVATDEWSYKRNEAK